MVNAEELAICRKRGHETRSEHLGWAQCRYCRIWVRTRKVVEEREDDPPNAEMAPFDRLRKDFPDSDPSPLG